MATRKKSKKKSIGSKKRSGRKSPAKPPARKQKTAKKLAERKTVPKKATKRKALAKPSTKKTQSGTGKKSQNQSLGTRSSAFSPETSGSQSGDLQGLSNLENVDSESVDELLEEGNAFEA